jgi:hypothetical protein
VMVSKRTTTATSNDRRKTSGAFDVAASELSATSGGPNKPVLPTATTSLNHYAPGPLRRQTGQSFGRREDKRVGPRASKSKTWAAFNGQRAVFNEQRTAGNEQRATSSGRRAAFDGQQAASGGCGAVGDDGVTVSRRTTTATSDDLRKTSGAFDVAACELSATSGGPNKPVLPTATTALNHYAPGPLRRQTGQSLGTHGEAEVGSPFEVRARDTTREYWAPSGDCS